MEKRTIGSLIATLRRANGMTQRELAERLHVSDKTVSRWECDEGTPDLALIPVIAEIFHISCDELLRGECKSAEERAADTESAGGGISARAEKQRKRLFHASMAQYQIHTFIAVGISVIGFLAALICNLAFLRAVLGFLVGTVFFVTGVIFQIICMKRTLLSVDDEELADLPEWHAFRKKVIRWLELSLGATTGMFGFTLPFLLVSDVYAGLAWNDMFRLGLLSAAAFLLLFAITVRFVNARLIRTGICVLSDKEAQTLRRKHTLQNTCGITLVCLLLVTFIAQWTANNFFGAHITAKDHMVFEDYDSFIRFMEQEMDPSGRIDPASTYFTLDGLSSGTAPIPVDTPENTDVYEDDACIERLLDDQGNVLAEYRNRNESVWRISYGETDTKLPISVSTVEELREARRAVERRNAVFVCAYLLETCGVAAVYYFKRIRCAAD